VIKFYAYSIEDENGNEIFKYVGIVHTSCIAEAYCIGLDDAIYYIETGKYNVITLKVYAPPSSFDIDEKYRTNSYILQAKKDLLNRIAPYNVEVYRIEPMHISVLKSEILKKVEEYKDKLVRCSIDTIKEVERHDGSVLIYWRDRQCGEIHGDYYISVRYPEHFCIIAKGWGIQKDIIEYLKMKKRVRYLIIKYVGKKGIRLYYTTLSKFVKEATTMCLREEDGDQMFLSENLWKIRGKDNKPIVTKSAEKVMPLDKFMGAD
jgi:hypothetical protein